MPPHSATRAWRSIPGFPQLVRPSSTQGYLGTLHGPCPSKPPLLPGPAAPIASARPWVGLTLTLLISESESKSRDVETRQSRPSLAELSWPTCPLILFNFIVSLLICWLLPSPFLRLLPSLTHTFTLIDILVVPSSRKSSPSSQPKLKPATPTHIPTPLTRAGFLHRIIPT